MADFIGEKGCGPTHHEGCECHEARRNAELAQLRAEVERLNKEVQRWQKLSEMHADSEAKWKDEAIGPAEAAEARVRELEAKLERTRGHMADARKRDQEESDMTLDGVLAQLESCQADCAAQRLKHVSAVEALDEAVSRLKEVLDRQTAPLDEDCFDLGALARLTRLLAEQRAAPQRPAGAALLEELRAARGVVEAARALTEAASNPDAGPKDFHDVWQDSEKALAAYDRAVGEKGPPEWGCRDDEA